MKTEENELLSKHLQSKKLSKSQSKIVEYVIQGYHYPEVADIVGLTAGTVKMYMTVIFAKLGVTNKIELMLYCMPFMDMEQVKNKFHS